MKRIDEINAEIASTHAAITEHETAISELRSALFKLNEERRAFEREAERNKKPTAKMLALLGEIAQGNNLKSSRRWGGGISWWMDMQSINASVADGLRERELIQVSEGDHYRSTTYTISDWGREVLAKVKQ